MNAPQRHRVLLDLLHSPLGILVLASSIIEVSGTPLEMPFADQLGGYPADDGAHCLQELSKREAIKGYFDLLSPQRLSELIVQCGWDLTPYRQSYRAQTEVLLTYGSSLRPFAECLLEAPGTASWFVDLDRKRQEWVSPTALAPVSSSFSPDLHPVGSGITKARGTLWTSTSLSNSSSGWLHYMRGGAERRLPPYHRWHLDVLPTARIYEVHGPQAWHTLCLSYPAPSCLAYQVGLPEALIRGTLNGFIEPNWQGVVQDWDGIHLSVGGLLTTERVIWGEPGAQTHLFSWDVESTMWLRWAFGWVERLPDVG